jgi:hypothetical protein
VHASCVIAWKYLFLVCDHELFFYSFFVEVTIYRQKRGSTKSKGKRTGIMSNPKPQVQGLVRKAAQMVMRMEKDTMKHPPRCRCVTKIVAVVLLLLFPAGTPI